MNETAGRNIVVCCDGTANEFAADRTNVVKLYYALTQDRDRQITYYHPGLGTMEPPGALTSVGRRVTRVLGKAIGYGLSADVRDSYVFIMENFRPGDRLFLFGFSRGAYTVRAVASLLKMYGLLPPGNASFVPYAIRMLTSIERGEDADNKRYFELAGEFKEAFDAAAVCKPNFVGVWDTVSSVGWITNPLALPYTANNPDIAIGRHAVAIDERRAFFRTNLWYPSTHGPAGPKDLKQVWFPGVHADVGGGYPEGESALSKIPLTWMLDEAAAAGLLVDPVRKNRVLGLSGAPYVRADPKGEIHNSLSAAWWPAELVWKKHYDRATGKTARRMNFWRGRTIPPYSSIHVSAYQRGDEYASKLPADAVKVQ
ncbi:T6SS phospholipase effector Tle1-like catalytic domain-containing protein [Bradyrhizobium japonicum]|uniref:T6SS phospholipase effector Tle1-like catalytic domain-containing protein n=1 Tax=Bradyrhizobium japonicum TaxID=375 RepID=UPI001BAA2261|nr:DUF2235 domain-containing protein [Bradyrhizobium japonicum]MBR0911464.1 DUF2235 domain-containing protein [Bradyrhizobium japonicum]